MKLISLNIWGGRRLEGLMNYIKSRKKDTDIFCFQEVYDTQTNRKLVKRKFRADILKKIKNELRRFDVYFVSNISDFSFADSVNFDLCWGIAIFVKKSVSLIEAKSEYIWGYVDSELNQDMPKPRKVQLVKIEKEGKVYTIIHFHGLWVKNEKIDTKESLLQSQKIRGIMDKIHGNKIICGDFNLLPNTKSLLILEKDFTNLIKKYNITSTRSKFYNKPDKYADYVLVSQRIKVNSFSVSNLNISDHLPMELDFV